MLNGLDERFVLIGITSIRSNRCRYSVKTPFLLCCLPFRKADEPHFLRYQSFAVDDYSYNLDALELRHHRLLQR